MAYGVAFLLLPCSLITLSLTFGQDRPTIITIPRGPTTAPATAPQTVTGLQPAPAKQPEAEKLTPLGRQFKLSARAGGDWLCRANRPDGRFNYGCLPALINSKLEGDHYLRQAGAAFAVARAAHYFGDERMTAVARQAVLTLLADTEQEKVLRHTTWPSLVVNRLGAAGLLVLAINELPAPADELLEQSEQMCAFIRLAQQADGSMSFTDGAADQGEVHDPDGIHYYPGEALYALMRSQQHRPEAWKTDVVRKALAFYRPWWQKHRSMAFVPWQTAAYAEAYLLTGDKEFAEFVFEMNDWICTLQYAQLDPRHPLWVGGFMGYVDGKPSEERPQIGSTAYSEGLAEACRVARKAGDVGRYQRYGLALERSLQFAMTLQYSEGNTQHFSDWYRPRLLGGFHASDQDGNLRIDYTQHAIAALLQYLQFVSVPEQPALAP
jgi:hypothetical protein